VTAPALRQEDNVYYQEDGIGHSHCER
jgi:hypothetical protein